MSVEEYCAGGLVFYNRRLLMIHRIRGTWIFPKGHIDPGETPEEAALREVREESGIQARITRKLSETSYRFIENGLTHHKTVQWFLMEALSDQVVLETELFNDSAWISEPEINRLTYTNDRRIALLAFQVFGEVGESESNIS